MPEPPSRTRGGRAPPPTWKGSGSAPGGHALTGTFSRPRAISRRCVGASGPSSDAAIPARLFLYCFHRHFAPSRCARHLDEFEPRRECWESWVVQPRRRLGVVVFLYNWPVRASSQLSWSFGVALPRHKILIKPRNCLIH